MAGKKTVSMPHQGEEDFRAWREREDLPLLAPVLAPYFKRWGAHARFIPFPYIPSGTVLFYNTWQPRGARRQHLNVQVPEDSEPLFYDHRPIVETLEDGISIYVGDRFAGTIIPGRNILFATDWSHYVTLSMRLFVRSILHELVEKGLLLPLERLGEDGYVPPTPSGGFEVTVGGDPEFELIRNGTIIRADSQEGFNTESRIGADGCGGPAELRPKWSHRPEVVVESVSDLLVELAGKGYDIAHQGHVHALGGHIHVGGVRPCEPLIELLDDFIGKLTIGLSGKARGAYKRLGAWRSQPHGFEYRTVPAAIWSHPRIAGICLALAKNLVENLIYQGQVTYNDPPAVGDYVSVGGISADDAEFFLNWCLNRTHEAIDMMAAWRLPTKPWHEAIHLSREDKWPADAWPALARVFCGYRFHRSIILFGFAADKGLVFNWPCPIGSQIAFAYQRNPYHSYGFPRAIRDNVEAFEAALGHLRNYLIAVGTIVPTRKEEACA